MRYGVATMITASGEYFAAVIAARKPPKLLPQSANGLPAEAIAILLPIDRLLDTVRTVVNVQGDMMISVVVDRYAKQTEIEPS